ncbi:ATP binding, partial [Rhizoctonia solani]
MLHVAPPSKAPTNDASACEHEFLRSAAVFTGFVPADQASGRIQLVTKTGASVHFCVHRTSLKSFLKTGMNFAACDAGEYTVETILYSVISSYPIIRQVDDLTEATVAEFGRLFKKSFEDVSEGFYINVANARFNNTALGIRRAKMRLSVSAVKRFFEQSLKGIIESIDEQLSGFRVPYVLMFGSLGDMPYIRSECKKRYEPRGSQVICADFTSHSTIAAEGAVLWSIVNSLSLLHYCTALWHQSTSQTY